ncbi:MAG: hypothetical protein LBV70_01895 [Candidatus Adiutrix sp.]|jgi:hypothetical protein|nr:hypothetical protein [Candidatus Adiutrix sp.]
MAWADWTYLLDRAELLRAVLEFNGLTKPPDFGPAQGTPLAAALAATPRLWRLRPRGDEPMEAPVWCFEPEINRLALLPPEVTDGLELQWGAAVLAERAARAIEGDACRRLRAEWGPELYGYALKRGRYQLGSLRSAFQAEQAEMEDDGVRDQAQALGRMALNIGRAQWPEELRSAWAARRRLENQVPGRIADQGLAGRVFPWLKKILLTEVAPSWRPCFNC